MTTTSAETPRWRAVESSHVVEVGWDKAGTGMFVRFTGGGLYLYRGVSRQRAVAMIHAESVGQYLHRKIIPNFTAVRLS
jgi:hypothetical protein